MKKLNPIRKLLLPLLLFVMVADGCSKKSSTPVLPPPPTPVNFSVSSWWLNGNLNQSLYYDAGNNPIVKFQFSSAINRSTVASALSFIDNTGTAVGYSVTYEKADSVLLLQPSATLKPITKYTIAVSDQLKGKDGGSFLTPSTLRFLTSIDSTNKFPVISDDSLLTVVEKQTFTYFWDFGHPVSGLARERNSSGETVTSGGSGFGVMAIVTGVHRNFITRAQALTRLQTITGFLKNTAKIFHGAFPHWLNGTTGAAIPFSTKDDGADLVETSYLVMGLLTARQYFNGADPAETALRADINAIINKVEWSWFRKGAENVLYWHWSPNYSWDMNMPIKGWNECLITYVLAASSTSFNIPKVVYDNGWAQNGAMKNNNVYYGYNLPLGPAYGGPLFMSQYSFLGINPNGLTDVYANYQQQATNHSKINYEYTRANPKKYFGYSSSCWGLTASDIPNGYTASSPTNDIGVIAPTAALSAMPFVPAESMQALKFFYYTMGDKLWKQYGFVDAFSLDNPWFADSFLAIDQGPIIIMIENYRSGLLWNLFTSCPEVKTGMLSLGFTAPYL